MLFNTFSWFSNDTRSSPMLIKKLVEETPAPKYNGTGIVFIGKPCWEFVKHIWNGPEQYHMVKHHQHPDHLHYRKYYYPFTHGNTLYSRRCMFEQQTPAPYMMTFFVTPEMYSHEDLTLFIKAAITPFFSEGDERRSERIFIVDPKNYLLGIWNSGGFLINDPKEFVQTGLFECGATWTDFYNKVFNVDKPYTKWGSSKTRFGIIVPTSDSVFPMEQWLDRMEQDQNIFIAKIATDGVCLKLCVLDCVECIFAVSTTPDDIKNILKKFQSNVAFYKTDNICILSQKTLPPEIVTHPKIAIIRDPEDFWKTLKINKSDFEELVSVVNIVLPSEAPEEPSSPVQTPKIYKVPDGDTPLNAMLTPAYKPTDEAMPIDYRPVVFSLKPEDTSTSMEIESQRPKERPRLVLNLSVPETDPLDQKTTNHETPTPVRPSQTVEVKFHLEYKPGDDKNVVSVEEKRCLAESQFVAVFHQEEKADNTQETLPVEQPNPTPVMNQRTTEIQGTIPDAPLTPEATPSPSQPPPAPKKKRRAEALHVESRYSLRKRKKVNYVD